MDLDPGLVLVVVPPGKDNENITNTHVTQSDLGNIKGAGQVEEDIISPSKRLGFGFICE